MMTAPLPPVEKPETAEPSVHIRQSAGGRDERKDRALSRGSSGDDKRETVPGGSWMIERCPGEKS